MIPATESGRLFPGGRPKRDGRFSAREKRGTGAENGALRAPVRRTRPSRAGGCAARFSAPGARRPAASQKKDRVLLTFGGDGI